MARIARKPEKGQAARLIHKAKAENKKSFAQRKEELSEKAKEWIGKKHIIKGDTVIELASGPQKYKTGGKATHGYGKAYLKGGRDK